LSLKNNEKRDYLDAHQKLLVVRFLWYAVREKRDYLGAAPKAANRFFLFKWGNYYGQKI